MASSSNIHLLPPIRHCRHEGILARFRAFSSAYGGDQIFPYIKIAWNLINGIPVDRHDFLQLDHLCRLAAGSDGTREKSTFFFFVMCLFSIVDSSMKIVLPFEYTTIQLKKLMKTYNRSVDGRFVKGRYGRGIITMANNTTISFEYIDSSDRRFPLSVLKGEDGQILIGVNNPDTCGFKTLLEYIRLQVHTTSGVTKNPLYLDHACHEITEFGPSLYSTYVSGEEPTDAVWKILNEWMLLDEHIYAKLLVIISLCHWSGIPIVVYTDRKIIHRDVIETACKVYSQSTLIKAYASNHEENKLCVEMFARERCDEKKDVSIEFIHVGDDEVLLENRFDAKNWKLYLNVRCVH